MRTRVGIIFGGRSGEHEISIRSAKTVIESIDSDKYEVVPIAIMDDGRWLSPAESVRQFPDHTQKVFRDGQGEASESLITLSGDATIDPFTALVEMGGEESGRGRPRSVIFPVLHGTYGEDGTIQGLFEMADLPYVGCGVLASSCGMDKAFMKTLFRDAGLPICDYVWFLRDEWQNNRETTLKQVAD
ncbi:MAG: D-alanine--D-alanine ligase A, partial [Pyrinomonadaceae bacterium]